MTWCVSQVLLGRRLDAMHCRPTFNRLPMGLAVSRFFLDLDHKNCSWSDPIVLRKFNYRDLVVHDN